LQQTLIAQTKGIFRLELDRGGKAHRLSF
jgi:hypothetical protein